MHAQRISIDAHYHTLTKAQYRKWRGNHHRSGSLRNGLVEDEREAEDRNGYQHSTNAEQEAKLYFLLDIEPEMSKHRKRKDYKRNIYYYVANRH
jgi:hypothetical protein